jgi:hypothetical protein
MLTILNWIIERILNKKIIYIIACEREEPSSPSSIARASNANQIFEYWRTG